MVPDTMWLFPPSQCLNDFFICLCLEASHITEGYLLLFTKLQQMCKVSEGRISVKEGQPTAYVQMQYLLESSSGFAREWKPSTDLHGAAESHTMPTSTANHGRATQWFWFCISDCHFHLMCVKTMYRHFNWYMPHDRRKWQRKMNID